jgi:hypothetical protein
MKTSFQFKFFSLLALVFTLGCANKERLEEEQPLEKKRQETRPQRTGTDRR